MFGTGFLFWLVVRMSIELNYKSVASDFRRILLWYRWKWRVATLAVTLLIVSSLIFYLSEMMPANSDTNLRLTAIVSLLIFLLVIGLTTYLGINRQARKLEKICEFTTVTFDQEGLKSVSANTTREVRWERYQKVVETSQDFIFFPQDNIFFGIPKRYFDNADDIAALRHLIQKQMGERAKMKN